MKKIVWFTFFAALIAVNLLAWLVNVFGDVYIPLPYRLSLVLGITVGATVFSGVYMLITKLEEEKPNNDS